MFDDIIGEKLAVILYADAFDFTTVTMSLRIGIVKKSMADGCILRNDVFIDRRQICKILPDTYVATYEETVQFFAEKNKKNIS